MIWTVLIVVLFMWFLGVVTGYVLNGLIHLLLLVAILVVVIRVVQRRRL